MSYNHIEKLDAALFVGATSLKKLFLSSNKISYLHSRAFDGLGRLGDLELTGNELTDLPSTIFHSTPELQRLFIVRNKLTILRDNVFQRTRKLERLYAYDNEFTYISNKTFTGLSHLRFLFLPYNNISRVFPGAFKDLAQLRALDLSGNLLSGVLGTDMFSGLSNLNRVEFDRNKLTGIDKNAFIDCPKIYDISVSNNFIESIPIGTFRHFRSLRQLDLSRNNIKELRSGVFNTSYLSLNLNYNQISFLSQSVFRVDTVSLHELYLRSNNLTSASWSAGLENLLGNMKRLYRFDLSDNRLGYIPAKVLQSFATMDDVNLRNCSIAKLPTYDLDVPEDIDFSENNIQYPLSIKTKKVLSPRVHVSYTNITTLNIQIEFDKWYYLWIECDQNKLQESLKIEIYYPESNTPQLRLSARSNMLHKPVQLRFERNLRSENVSFPTSVDLSNNKYMRIIKFPLEVTLNSNSSTEVWNPCETSTRFNISVKS